MKNLLVSVGLPVVKTNFLKKSIECCLSQTYENIEVIVLNNASNITTRDEIRAAVFEFNDKRIVYYENESQIPMVQNWNKTLEYAKGDLFALLSDDDYWEPSFLDEIINLSKKWVNIDIFHVRLARIDEFDNLIDLSPICPELESGIDFIIHRLSGYRVVYLSDFVVRTNALKKIGGFVDLPDGWGSDIFTWFTLSMNGGIAYTSEVLFNYRFSNISVTNSKEYGKKISAINLQRIMLVDLLKDCKVSDNKFDLVKIEMFKKEIIKFNDKNKKYIVHKILQQKFKFPEGLAHFISSIYQYFLRVYSERSGT